MIYHVSSAEGVAIIRAARRRGLKVFAETCPQYLFLTKNDLDKPGIEGAKWMCSPPLRETSDQEALWQALSLGDLQLVSSDHAPYAFNEKGKLMAGESANFKQIPNGMPGLQARLPLLFDAMVSNGRFGAEKFVEWTAAAPAQIYGLAPRKGSIAVGADADIAIWDPDKQVTFADADVVDGAGYTPYVGRTVRGWPVTVLRRGEIIAENGRCLAAPGSGEFLPRDGGPAAEPLGRPSPEFDPQKNFGAQLY
jgi:dihydropyrimidinase